MATPNLTLLEKKIKVKFTNERLLEEAMTHKSFSIEHGMPACNERMEFLGDSIIAAVVANWLYERFPNVDEGKLSKMKSQIVSRNNLSVWADEWDLGEYLFLSQGEEATGGRKRESLLGNAYEALVGAIFIDQGFEAAQKFVLKHLSQRKRIVENDFKSKLQEVVQKKYKIPPMYVVVAETGPDHEKTFTLEVRIKQRLLGKGEGRSKKEAEQLAAKEALKIIKNS
jgi:ribonuclease-3